MKTTLIALASVLLFGCAQTPPPATALRAHEVTVHQIVAVKVTGEMVKVENDTSADENPYDAMLEEQAREEADQQKVAEQAEKDKKLHDLMVKAVWGNCAPGDPSCSVIDEPEVKADTK